MNETIVLLQVSADDGQTWKDTSAKPSSAVLAYLYNQGSPWYDVATGLTYRWPQ